jgi:hypothetical protein
LTFLKNVQGGITPTYIKVLRISDYSWPNQFYTRDQFSYVIQSLKGLETLELKGDQEKWYLDIMVNNIQIEDMKQIKRIIIGQGYDAETKKCYFELVYKLRETITNLSDIPTDTPEPPRFNIHNLPEFKSLTHLEIQRQFSGNIDFISILRLCPKLQYLLLNQSYSTPPLPPSKKLMVHNNLKSLYLFLLEFPRHYVTYITSCIPPTIDHFELSVIDDEKNWICSGFAETMLVDQFLAHLSKMRDMNLSLASKIQQRTHSGYVNQMARTWHFANSIQGRREKMITKAKIWLISCIEDAPPYLGFSARENKYFDLCQYLGRCTNK